MKRIFVLIFMIFLATPAISQDFSYLDDLSAVQKQKLSQIYHSYKQENNSLEMRIMDYQTKLNKLETLQDRSAEQINLLKTAYERNIKTLAVQQELLKSKTERMYEAVMTPNQYKQHLAQQMQIENAFSDFLRK